MARRTLRHGLSHSRSTGAYSAKCLAGPTPPALPLRQRPPASHPHGRHGPGPPARSPGGSASARGASRTRRPPTAKEAVSAFGPECLDRGAAGRFLFSPSGRNAGALHYFAAPCSCIRTSPTPRSAGCQRAYAPRSGSATRREPGDAPWSSVDRPKRPSRQAARTPQKRIARGCHRDAVHVSVRGDVVPRPRSGPDA